MDGRNRLLRREVPLIENPLHHHHHPSNAAPAHHRLLTSEVLYNHRSPPPPPYLHPAVIEERLTSQHHEIQSLLIDNQRLGATHVALRQELTAAQEELRHISAAASHVKADRDAQIREVYDQSIKLEAEVRLIDTLNADLALVRSDVQKLSASKSELTSELQGINDELKQVREELHPLPSLKAEIEKMHHELQRGSFKNPSYNGGGSITAKGTLQGNAYVTTRLFRGELPLENLPIYITYSVRSDGRSLVGLSLVFANNTSTRMSVLLAASGDTLITLNQFASKFDKVIMPLRVAKLETESPGPPWAIQESSIAMNGYTLTDIHMVCYKSKPEISDSTSEQDPSSEGTKASQNEYCASLGHLAIRTSDENLNFLPYTSWVVEGQYISWVKSDSNLSKTLSLKIFWRLKKDQGLSFHKYNIYVCRITKEASDRKTEGPKEYLGVARVQAFYVSDLAVPGGISSIKFIVQVCRSDGAWQELDSSPSFLLDVEGSGMIKNPYANKEVFPMQKWGTRGRIWESIMKGIEVVQRFITNILRYDSDQYSLTELKTFIGEMFPPKMADKVLRIYAGSKIFVGRLTLLLTHRILHKMEQNASYSCANEIALKI